MKNWKRLATVHISGCALVLSGCAGGPGALGGAGNNSYTQSCLTGALLGGVLAAVLSKDKKPAGNTIAAAALGGCAIGLATTAIARVMDQNQQARHEEAMQREARRLALEQQKYAAAQSQAAAMPAATPAQRQARDASLEKARAEYQQSYSKPVTVDIGGGTSTITPQPPKEEPKAGQLACFDQTVLVQTARGQAKQTETWCPNAQGQFARVEARGEKQG